MFVFDHADFDQHERIGFFHDQETGLKAIIAIHSTNLGPALGGCRMWDYQTEDEAVKDVLRLSRGMTYKAAIAGVPLGGGKSVIIGDSKKLKTPELMQAMGRAVQQMGGDYTIAEDVGMTVDDMVEIAKQTDYAVGLPAKEGEGGGDPSPTTAHGVFVGLKAAVKKALGKDTVQGLKVVIQGLGSVGYKFARHLHNEGAELYVTDINTESVNMAVDEFGATAIGLDEVYDMDADIYAPCALGGTLNDDTIERLKVRIVAGAANNQLAELRHAKVLQDKGILYTPDYVINAGGLITVFHERQARLGVKKYTTEAVLADTNKIFDTTMMVFERAEKDGITTAEAADRIAEDRFKKLKTMTDMAA